MAGIGRQVRDRASQVLIEHPVGDRADRPAN
jgi:hypothetical protein